MCEFRPLAGVIVKAQVVSSLQTSQDFRNTQQNILRNVTS